MNRCPANFRARLVAIAIILSLATGGCELIPLATLGAVFDIAGSAATTGPAVYKMGKLDIAFLADFTTVQQAVRTAAYDLRLIVIDDRDDSAHATWQLQVEDNLHSPITITVEHRTPMLCRCRVDVGLFGSEPTARLVMTRIISHLPSPAKQPAHSPGAIPITADKTLSPLERQS